MTRITALSLLAAMFPALYAVAQSEPLPPRQYGRALPIDAIHTRLDIAVDIQNETVEGVASLTVAPVGRDLSTISLDGNDLEVFSVTDEEDRPLEYENTGEQIHVYFDTPAPAGEPVTLNIAYKAARPQRGLYFRNANNGYSEAETNVWSQGETEDNRYWFPCWDFPNDRATSEILVTIPSGFDAFANGELVNVADNADDTRTYHWLHDTPHVNYLISLVIGHYTVIEDQVGDIPLRYIVRPELEETVERSFGKTPDMMTFFEEWTAHPYPWGTYSQIAVVDFIYGGMENTGITTMTEKMLHDESSGLVYSADGLVAHELAHQWFGNLLTCRDWSHLWLNEGFATYFQALYFAHAFGEDEFMNEMIRYRERLYPLERGSGRAPVVKQHYASPDEAINRRVYNKGAWILHMLRHKLGDDLFQTGIREYIHRYQYTSVETNQLMRVLEEVSGQGLEKFFDQWLYHAGYPEIDFDYSWNEKESTADVTIKQTQSIKNQTPIFEFTVPVLFALDDGEHIETVDVTGDEKSLSVPLPERPLFVRFDPDGTLLCKLDSKPGKDQALAQLRRDPRILGRIEALEALTEFTTDDAFEAITATLQDDPYWGVRARAAKALGELDHLRTIQPLVDALGQQPDARVRRAAANALDNAHDTERAGRALVTAIQQDKSPHVVAAAMGAAASLRYEPALRSIRSGLKRDSHAEIIREGAVNALVKFGDQDALNDVAALAAPSQPRDARIAAISGVAHIGRWMADQTRARETLEGFLDDPNRRIRMAAVNALGTLGDEKAIPEVERFTRQTRNEYEKRAARTALRALRDRKPPSQELKDLRDTVDNLLETQKELRERLDELETEPLSGRTDDAA